MIDPRPLILTLRFDSPTFATLDALRQAHFPAPRNHLPAHLTLFHHLPGTEFSRVRAAVRRAAVRSAFPVLFTGLRPLGRGVAFGVEAPELGALRASIAETFADDLTSQDRQRFRPHVTIQNKATPGEARALLEVLSETFVPWRGQAEGLLLWRYLGPAWALEADMPFGLHEAGTGIADSVGRR